MKTGEQDGVRIDFLGTSDGTSPELAPPPSPPNGRDNPSAAGAAAVTAAAAEMPFGLLRCDGESYRDGEEGGLTVKGVCDHMLRKLMESAQRVRARI